jgi:sirohydrochlorin ferrochelatase
MTSSGTKTLRAALEKLASDAGCTMATTGVVLVDHGSRRDESNQLLHEVARMLRERGPFAIVEPAHMELAEPSIGTAVGRCHQQGAQLVIVSPFFLLPGRHMTEDIPHLARAAAEAHSGMEYRVAPPLGTHPLLVEILLQRIAEI